LTKDLAASVRQRLMNRATQSNRPFQEVLQYFTMERFLYRLSASAHAEQFILKGALMFTTWGLASTRATKDIDLLARMSNDVETVVDVMREVCSQRVESDGLAFDLGSMKGTTIKEDADYSGVRVTFLVRLQTARISMQIDVGFGDVVTPPATKFVYPAMLEFAAPQLMGYPRETVVAEKFEAMMKLGLLNSRMKDFFDLLVLSRKFEFEGANLANAIRRTCANRNTTVVRLPLALTPAFGSDPTKRTQWRGFLKKTVLESVPDSLQAVIDELALFLSPVAKAIESGSSFNQHWPPLGPWE